MSMHESASRENSADRPEETQQKQGGFWGKYGSTILLVVLFGYLILLAIGVVAEVFKIQSILDWWIWKPPGKP